MGKPLLYILGKGPESTQGTDQMLFRVTHNYLGHHLGYVTAIDSHDAICIFSKRSGMALAAIVATPHNLNWGV